MSIDPLLEPAALRRFLRDHRLPPLDRFGQHFLVDADVLEAIVAAVAEPPPVPIIEIGAGFGVLTRALAHAREQEGGNKEWHPAPIYAVELDRRLIPLLQERAREWTSVRVVHADILKTTPASLLPPSDSLHPRRYDVAGNIPYNITAKLLRHVFGWTPRPRVVTFLLDAAVAERITARPPAMSILAIAVQTYAEPAILCAPIPPSAFLPPPAVSSALVRFRVRETPLIPSTDERTFFALVRAGFSQKRKTLTNALRAAWRCSAADAARQLRDAGIEPTRRAQTLSIAEWRALLAALPAEPPSSRT